MSSIFDRLEESGRITIFENKNNSQDYKRNYDQKHHLCYEIGKTLYYKDERLFGLTKLFLKFKWVDRVVDELDRFIKGIVSEEQEEWRKQEIYEKRRIIRGQIRDILSQNIPFPERIKNSKIHLHKTDLKKREYYKWSGIMEHVPFGSCLFISGISGIGKTRFLNFFEVNSNCNDNYVCYLDLLKTGGAINDHIISNLLREYFGDCFKNINYFISEYSKNSDQANVVFAIDNLDYAFQRGLQPDELKRLIHQFSACDQIKWIFTINSGQRYLIWHLESMEKLAKDYAFVHIGDPYSRYLIHFDYDLNKFSSESRVFESIIRNYYSIQSSEEILLRNIRSYEYYLTPYVAELIIELHWSWEKIQNLTSLIYLKLCEKYYLSKLDAFVPYKDEKDDLSAFDWKSKCENMCIELGLHQLKDGEDTWGDEDISVFHENKPIYLKSTDIISVIPQKDSVGHCFQEYSASDKIFWSTLNSKTLYCEMDSSSISWRDRVLKCVDNSTARYTHLSYYKELQILYYLRTIKYNRITPDESKELSSNNKIPQQYKELLSPQVFPVVARTIPYADERFQKSFLKSCMLFLKNSKETLDQKEAYMYLNLIFEFFGAIRTTENDLITLVNSCKQYILTIKPNSIISEFSRLLLKKRGHISDFALNYILCSIGNADAIAFEPLADAICDLYIDAYREDYVSLIHSLLNDSGLRVLKKRYRHLNRAKLEKEKEDYRSSSRGYYTHSNNFPYCLIESTISKVCDNIVQDLGIIKSHLLLWENGWYDEKKYDPEDKKSLPFFVDLRRKSLNLALANVARNDYGSMKELESLIESCLEHRGDSFAEKTYREEALFLCRNSVLAEEKSPFKFTDKIYKYLAGFTEDPAMGFLMKSTDVQQYYARHNIFCLFNNRDISIALKDNKESLKMCKVISSNKESIKVTINEKETRTIKWNTIRRIYFKHWAK